MSARAEVDELVVADPPEAWERLGFTVVDGVVPVGGVRIRPAGPDAGDGLVGWSLRGLRRTDLDGLPTARSTAPPPAPVEHPVGAVAVDHAVALTPDFERTVAALRDAGLDLRRVRDAGEHRQAFFVVGPMLLELSGPHGDGPPRFWGLVVVVEDLDAAAARLGDRLRPAKDAVQPGRRIATLSGEAGLSAPLALMTPRQ